MNEIFRAFERPIDWRQQVALAVYTATAAVCALNLALNNGWHATSVPGITTRRIRSSCTPVSCSLTWRGGCGARHAARCHGGAPDALTIHPYDYLPLVMMQVTAVCLLASASVRCVSATST